jgi:hypothetical protein
LSAWPHSAAAAKKIRHFNFLSRCRYQDWFQIPLKSKIEMGRESKNGCDLGWGQQSRKGEMKHKIPLMRGET